MNFQNFWLKCQFSPYARYVIKNLLKFVITSELVISIFLDSYAYLLRIARFRSKTCIFVIFDKNIIFFWLLRVCRDFSFVCG